MEKNLNNVVALHDNNETDEYNETNKEKSVRINVVRRTLPYSTLCRFVDFVVSLSVDSNGKYHKYLRDYAEALALLIMFTDLKDIDDEEDGEPDNDVRSTKRFETVMTIAHSKAWGEEFIPEIGHMYDIFNDYVDAEIQSVTAPLSNVDGMVNTVTRVLNNINEILNAIDVEKLKEADFTQLMEAANSLEKLNN